MHICQLSTIFFACSHEGSNYWTGASPAPHFLLCDLPRVGTEVVNQLLATVGDNPDHLANEAQVTPLIDSFTANRLHPIGLGSTRHTHP